MNTPKTLSFPLRRRLVVLPIVLVFALGLGPAFQPAWSQSEFRQNVGILDDLKLEPIAFNPPPVETRELDGGATLLLARDDTLPSVSLSLFFTGGTSVENIAAGANAAGAGSLSAALQLIETGGAGQLSGDALAETLAAMGARLEFQSGYEFWSVKLTVLKSDFARGLELLEDSLLRPILPEDRLQIIRNSMLSQIERRNDDPAHVASRKLNELQFVGTRRGYSLTPADVRALNVDALRRDLRRRLRPGGLYVAASGDTSGLKIAERMNRLIAALPSAGESRPIEPTDPADLLPMLRERVAPLRGRILLVDTPAAQAVIAIGGYLPARNHPDLYALQTGNYILGGGSFNSRLTREIRVRRGLAYYAYSYNDFDGTPGRFLAGSGTRSLLAHRTLKLMLETIAGMRSDISGQELSLAQDAILNGLAFQFDSPEDAVLHAFRNRLHDMPADYLERFPERIRSMSAADLSAAARRYLDPDELHIVVAGPAGIKEKLEEIRPVIVIKPEDLIRDIRVAKR